MKKLIRDGKVAVLVSPGYGAGWYTWHDSLELLFDPEIVRLVENGKNHLIGEYVLRAYPDQHFYLGGADTLEVEWIPTGEKFRISEYDGSEHLTLESEQQWLTA